MESILARALEYTLKYWLRSFSRDQFRLQGRTVQLSNLDINGDALHASLGLPPALNVAAAKVGKLEIKLPYVSNVQVEPVVVQIDTLDLVLEEKSDKDSSRNSNSNQSSTSSGKGSGYGFADKIADGMTLEVGTVNLMLETRGGAQQHGGATWASPLASITIRKLLLYTTNENWEVVNLKEARDFSTNKKNIYVFKKLEWESLSVDLLPHPDMFTDAHLTSSGTGEKKRDDDGAKRVFFGGERFLEGISGQANITVQRTELNNPLGLEVQLHITEAVCPALSEPGLRAFLRFLTGLYVCLNRGYVDPKARQCSEAAGRSLVSIIVDHIFLCIKDSEFQLDLLMQSLFFSRASVPNGEITKNLTRLSVAGLFLRDTFSHPPCTLVQPSMQAVFEGHPNIPEFGKNFCPPIYPLEDKCLKVDGGVPLISLHTLQIKPSPLPPSLASQTVIDCQPLMINLQEESCLRISSFLADGVVVNPGVVLPDFSIKSLVFTLKEFDLTVPTDHTKLSINNGSGNGNHSERPFAGARLHVENLFISESPAIKFQLLKLEKDPSCFSFWEGQPVDSSQKKLLAKASHVSLSLETSSSSVDPKSSPNWSAGLWRCVELHDACFETAVATSDGSPLTTVPPPGGLVRIGVACQKFLSNTSAEQLFFVLDCYAYFGRVSEEIAKVGRSNKQESKPNKGSLMENVPSDTAVSLAVNELRLKFLESSLVDFQGMPLVQFGGDDLFVKVTHRTLGGAIAISSSLRWESVRVDCVDAADPLAVHESFTQKSNRCPQMRAVFWIDDECNFPFLDISSVHVMPYHVQDECHTMSVTARVAGVRLGGGMNYTEALLHRFGILGKDGGPGEGLSKGLKKLSSGPLSKLLMRSPVQEAGREESIDNGEHEDGEGGGLLDLGKPDDVEISIELRDWLFALEGAKDIEEGWCSNNVTNVGREERSWHTTFQSLQVKAKNNPKNESSDAGKLYSIQKYPVENITVSVDGLQALKPHVSNKINRTASSIGKANGVVGASGGVNLEAQMVLAEDRETLEMDKWAIENLKFSVKQPIEAVATKQELEHLAGLCKSEVDSMGRIAAGILRVLKLDGSIGRAALDQLSNLGTDGMDRIFSPEKLSRRSSASSLGYTPIKSFIENSPRHMEATVASLEAALSDSQAKCSALITEIDTPRNSLQLSELKELYQKLESMQNLLTTLRTQM
ncbi:hypothetical protein H6P81_007112 [Aristolochia fimbriata]|uniref:Chorein N-terminal domain-containing protein n=1 Tax=Aristolochia fimbriata TaxID=158543 RepID=A0AAV7EZH0_ARIFI|nr:hypothetical protein H6P81_007112 [Aristolochia fimbriata]